MTYQKQIGTHGERIAAQYLKDKGYQVIDQNFHAAYGEIDLIALEGDTVVFVEVKTRTSRTFGLPEESITPTKMDRMQKTALMWLQAHPNSPENWRIDVIALLLDRQFNIKDLQHFINAYL